jgi:large subunit ribosomal protein L5
MSTVPTLKKTYSEHVVPELIKSRGYKNKHEVPRITKVVLNTGIDSEADKNLIADVARDLGPDCRTEARVGKVQEGDREFQVAGRPGGWCACDASEETPCGSSFTVCCRSLFPRSEIFAGYLPSSMAKAITILASMILPSFPEITVENVKKTMGLGYHHCHDCIQ